MRKRNSSEKKRGLSSKKRVSLPFCTASFRTKRFDFSKRSETNQNQAHDDLTFAEYIRRVNPKFQFYGHIDKLIAVLQRVADGEISRLMVFMPPRHGKSETVSRLFSAYYLHRHPERWVAITSYAAELAFTLSRAARDNYLGAGGSLKDDAGAVKHWETGKGGGLWATGVGGPATGKGFHLGIIDDPLKNAEEAASETIREKQKDWYRSTFSTREEPNGAIVVIMTRWHEDDLAGWLLAHEASNEDEPEGWWTVTMRGLSDDDNAMMELTIPSAVAASLSLSEGQTVPFLEKCFLSLAQ